MRQALVRRPCTETSKPGRVWPQGPSDWAWFLFNRVKYSTPVLLDQAKSLLCARSMLLPLGFYDTKGRGVNRVQCVIGVKSVIDVNRGQNGKTSNNMGLFLMLTLFWSFLNRPKLRFVSISYIPHEIHPNHPNISLRHHYQLAPVECFSFFSVWNFYLSIWISNTSGWSDSQCTGRVGGVHIF